MIIPVCLASDRNFMQHLAVTMASILKNNRPEDIIRFYILENAFTEEDRQRLNRLKTIASCEIHYVDVQNRILEICPIPEHRLSIAAYFRLFIPHLIPQENRVIYLDCDIIVRSSLRELYQTDMKNNFVMGVRDVLSRWERIRLNIRHYVNSGVLLMDTQKMREHNIYQHFMDYILENQHDLRSHDQEVINKVLDHYVGYLPSKWNGFVLRLSTPQHTWSVNQANILHYVGHLKPWMPKTKLVMSEYYFQYLRLTPFADFEKEFRKKRFWWELSRIPSKLWHLVYQRTISRFKTFRTYRLLGGVISFKKKIKRNW